MNKKVNIQLINPHKLKKYENSKTPGPGSYTLKPTFADVPKYLLANMN